MNKYIKELQESIKQSKLSKDDSDLFSTKQFLLSSLKILAKNLQVDVLDLTNDKYFDVVKSMFNKSRAAAIMIVSKSDDKKIGEKVVIVDDNLLTYDQLSLEQILSLSPTNTNLECLVREMEYLTTLLPKQLTEEDMLSIISDNKLTSIKDVMAYFKATYPSQYDAKLLSNIAKTI